MRMRCSKVATDTPRGALSGGPSKPPDEAQCGVDDPCDKAEASQPREGPSRVAQSALPPGEPLEREVSSRGADVLLPSVCGDMR